MAQYPVSPIRHLLQRPWRAAGVLSLMILLSCGGDLKPYHDLLLPQAAGVGQGRVTAIWMGVNGFFLTDGECALYIDPFVSRYSLLKIAAGLPLTPREDLARAWIEATGGARALAVLVTHSHYDHAMDAPVFARLTGARLVGSASTAMIGRGAGLDPSRIVIVRGGDRLAFGRFRVRFIESRHTRFPFGYDPAPGEVIAPLVPPASSRAYRVGTVFALVIEHPSGTIVHHGSAGVIPGMYRGLRADTLLLSVPGNSDSESYLREVAVPLGPQLLVPIHCDNFFCSLDPGDDITLLPGVDIVGMVARVQALVDGCVVGTLAPGRSVVLLPPSAAVPSRAPR